MFYVSGTVLDTLVFADPYAVWVFIRDLNGYNTNYYQISDKNANAVNNMFTQLVTARSTGAIVLVGVNNTGQIELVFY